MLRFLTFALFFASISRGIHQIPHVRVVTLVNPPFVVARDDGSYDGFLIEMLREFQSRMKFSYDMYEVPDGKFGSKSPDGTWTGLIGELEIGRATMALAPLTITVPRQDAVAFSLPYMHSDLTAMFRRPSPGGKVPVATLADLAEFDDKFSVVVIKVPIRKKKYFSRFFLCSENGSEAISRFFLLKSPR